MVRNIPVHSYFSSPIYDKKINCNSWMVQMSIGDYLSMVDFESNIYQRNLQNLSFYKKLIEDLLNDTTMPPISVVYPSSKLDLEAGLSPQNAFIVLDGLQRTNCLLECRERISKGKSKGSIQSLEEFNKKIIYIEIWENLDLPQILYKMVVLNTGQKKMDYAHQVDILSGSIQNKLEEMRIPFYTVKDKNNGEYNNDMFPLSTITQGVVSFINGAPIPNKKNAAEFLFERFNLDNEDNQNGLALITDNKTYEYIYWVLNDLNNLLNVKYGENNPLKKYDVFLIALLASIGFCMKKNPEMLSVKIKLLEQSFEKKHDPFSLNLFTQHYSEFKTSIGDKRRRFIYDTFRDYFQSPEYYDELEWETVYGRIN
ncbi:hypothetical protein C518_2996 [Lysinibacillus fusiformis ZB2]|nr:hypothetical protein C518_2996 [Lysinibacillus fusiformis ZB2]